MLTQRNKRIFSGALAFLLLLFSLTACNNQGVGADNSSDPAETTETPRPTTSDYTIQRIDDQCYMVFDDISACKIKPIEGADIYYITWLEFSSVAELKNSVTQHLLDEGDKSIVATFFEEGEHGIRVCDFDRLLVPTLPEGYESLGLYWTGEQYSHCTESTSYGTATFKCNSVEGYERDLERDYISSFDKDFKREHPDYKEEELADRNAVQITYENTKHIRYTLTTEDKVFKVDEIYSAVTDITPNCVKVYCTEGEFNYIIELRRLIERPSEEFLLSFGMELYSE